MSRRLRTRDELRTLLEGDAVFLFADDGGGEGGGDGGGSADAQGGGDGEPQGGNDDAQGGGGDEGTLSKEEARKLRSENQNLRKRAKDAEAAKEQLERKDLDDKERLEKDVKDRDARLQTLEEQNRSLRIRVVAGEVGIPAERARAAAALVDWKDVDMEDDKAIADELKGLKKEHGYLFASEKRDESTSRGGQHDGGAGRGNNGRDATAEAVAAGPGRLRHAFAQQPKT